MGERIEPISFTGREMAAVLLVLLVVSATLLARLPSASESEWEPLPLPDALPISHFNGQIANLTVWAQEHMGPRLPGSENASRLRTYLNQTLTRYGWNVTQQTFSAPELDGTMLTNLIAKRGPGEVKAGAGTETGPLYMLGAHYDTRPYNDREPGNLSSWRPIPGANDGGSGVAVLLELARVLQPAVLTSEVWLVFFDGEDHGPYSNRMFLGSKYFSEHLEDGVAQRTKAFVLLDMIGDADLGIPREGNSDPQLLDELYTIAAALNETAFENRAGRAVTDDHIYVARRNIPAVDLIDFDYGGPGPGGLYWHTLNDTRDKVAAESLASVGRVVETWVRLKTTDPQGGCANGTVCADDSGSEEDSWASPPPDIDSMVVEKDATLFDGLYLLENLSVGPNTNLTVVKATVALAGNLTLGDGARLVLVDSIIASATNETGRILASSFHRHEGAEVILHRSEWWGPPL